MQDELDFGGELYISSKRAASEYGYTKDYIGQMARSGKIAAKLIGRNWYVLESDLQSKRKHKRSHSTKGEEHQIALSKGTDEQTNKAPTSIEVESSVQIPQEEINESSPVVEQMPVDLQPNEFIDGDDIDPKEIAKFAVMREPTRLEIERKKRQDALLAQMDIRYGESTPIYYDDEAPLFVQPVTRSERQRIDNSLDIDENMIIPRITDDSPLTGQTIEKSIEEDIAPRASVEVYRSRKVDEYAEPRFSLGRFALAGFMLVLALLGTLALSFLEKKSLVQNSGEQKVDTEIRLVSPGGENTASLLDRNK